MWVVLYEPVGGVIVEIKLFVVLKYCRTLFRTEHVLVEMLKEIEPFTCTLLHCFLEDHSNKGVVMPILCSNERAPVWIV